jgi:SAM-dependent methyltransferase
VGQPSATAGPGCQLCGATGHETLFAAPDRLGLSDGAFEVRRCAACGLAFTWPPAREQDLAAFYPPDYWGERTEPSRAWLERTQREKTRFVARHMPRGGRLLDVGCGAGFFLRALPPDVWDAWGVEISPRSAAAAERHLGPGRVWAGRLEDAPFADASFDVVTFWASLEHMVEPRAGLGRARALLRPSGLLVVQVPNIASYQARRFGPDWFALDLPRHRFHFSEQTLTRLLREAGFEPREVRFRSETHDAHALKQSLKSRWLRRPAALGRLRYYAAAPFLKVVDRLAGGATLTVAAAVAESAAPSAVRAR